jgi:hypothetical protein
VVLRLRDETGSGARSFSAGCANSIPPTGPFVLTVQLFDDGTLCATQET